MMVKLGRRHAWILVAVTATALVVWAMMRPDVQSVDTGVVTRGSLEVTIDEDGRMRMRRHTEVAAPVTGRLGEALVRQGDSVKQGSPVAVMYPAPLDPRQGEQAQASIDAAQWVRREAASRVTQARIALEAAGRARERAEKLSSAGAIAARELEETADAVQMRRRDLDAAMASERAAAEEERRARLSLMSGDAAVRTQAGRVVLRAPMSGRVLRVMEEHDRVVTAGTPILSIGDPRSLELVIPVRTADAPRIDVGADIILRLGGGDSALSGRVTRIEQGAFTKTSPLGVEEQRVNVIGELTTAPPGLGDEFAAASSIVVARAEDVLKVPSSALVPHEAGWAVFVVDGNRATLRVVALGRRGSSEAEVKSGLRSGEVVVLYPESALEDGARVARRE